MFRHTEMGPTRRQRVVAPRESRRSSRENPFFQSDCSRTRASTTHLMGSQAVVGWLWRRLKGSCHNGGATLPSRGNKINWIALAATTSTTMGHRRGQSSGSSHSPRIELHHDGAVTSQSDTGALPLGDSFMAPATD